MAPLPKRRHSTRRGGKREKQNMSVRLLNSVRCPKCATLRLSHRACRKCGFYR